MKSIFCLVVLFFCSISLAKNPKAVYTVPVPQELQAFASFSIEMLGAYGSDATVISYKLPLRLTGEPAVFVSLTRNSVNKNLWEGTDFRAECADDGEIAVCELFLLNKGLILKENLEKYLEKISAQNLPSQTVAPEMEAFMMSAQPFSISPSKNLLPKDIVQKDDIRKQLSVLDHFLSSEPAGILTQRLSGKED
ncbi:MAG: hypothetical protein K2Q26_12710 [Bdellovibrionales bacterium]|nr:hypothetical protein [Bdellovibrionales bacterium]